MTTWPEDELRKISESDDLHISPFREDGVTCGTPTWIWSVTFGDALYVRCYNGQRSRWYKAAVRQQAGRIAAAGLTKEVTFEKVDGETNDRIDDELKEGLRLVLEAEKLDPVSPITSYVATAAYLANDRIDDATARNTSGALTLFL